MNTKKNKRTSFNLITNIPATPFDCAIHRESGEYQTLQKAQAVAKANAIWPHVTSVEIWRGNNLVKKIFARKP